MDPNQFSALMQLRADLRVEMLQHMAHMHFLVPFIFVTMVALIAMARLNEKLKFFMVVAAIFGATNPHLMARQDLLIHRMAPAVAASENTMGVQGWENYHKPKVAPLTRILPRLDAEVAVPQLLLIVYAIWQAGRQFKTKLRNAAFQLACWAWFVSGGYELWLVLRTGASLMPPA